MQQATLFAPEELARVDPKEYTEVGFRRRRARVRLKEVWRKATGQLLEALRDLEGKDVYVGEYSDWWFFEGLLLRNLEVEVHRSFGEAADDMPRFVCLHGNRGRGTIRMFLQRLTSVRLQDYSDFRLYLLDFWNGWGEFPIEGHKPGGYKGLSLRYYTKGDRPTLELIEDSA